EPADRVAGNGRERGLPFRALSQRGVECLLFPRCFRRRRFAVRRRRLGDYGGSTGLGRFAHESRALSGTTRITTEAPPIHASRNREARASAAPLAGSLGLPGNMQFCPRGRLRREALLLAASAGGFVSPKLLGANHLAIHGAGNERIPFHLAALGVRDGHAINLERTANGALVVGLGFDQVGQGAELGTLRAD